MYSNNTHYQMKTTTPHFFVQHQLSQASPNFSYGSQNGSMGFVSHSIPNNSFNCASSSPFLIVTPKHTPMVEDDDDVVNANVDVPIDNPPFLDQGIFCTDEELARHDNAPLSKPSAFGDRKSIGVKKSITVEPLDVRNSLQDEYIDDEFDDEEEEENDEEDDQYQTEIMNVVEQMKQLGEERNKLLNSIIQSNKD